MRTAKGAREQRPLVQREGRHRDADPRRGGEHLEAVAAPPRTALERAHTPHPARHSVEAYDLDWGE
eukprot:scaffold35261_cov129-Isochrysis_galbana.AAC.2